MADHEDIVPEIDPSQSQDGANNPLYLLKLKGISDLGGRGDPIPGIKEFVPLDYFATGDIGILQSTALAQDLNTTEFSAGTPGEDNGSWIAYLNRGQEAFVNCLSRRVRQGNRFITVTIYKEAILTWDVDANNNRVTEQNWANAFVNAWNQQTLTASLSACPADGVPADASIQRTATTQANDQFGAQFWSNVKSILTDQAGADENTMSTADGVFALLQQIAGATSFVTLAGTPDVFLYPSYYRYYSPEDGSINPNPTFVGNIIDTINSLIADDQGSANEVISQNKANFFTLSKEITSFQNLLESRVGKLIQGELTVTGFRNIADGADVKQIPEGSDPADYTPLETLIPIYNNFIEALSQTNFGPVTTLTSGIELNHWLITHQTFTGLPDTPTGYQSGSFLYSTSSGIEYSSFDGNFTGLFDTPTGYVSGYYTRSSASGIEYISSTGVADDVISSMTGVGGTYLKLKDSGTGIEFVSVDNIEGTFTGLNDTPTGYESGYYLRSTKTGIEYISSTGLADDIGDEIVQAIVTGKLFDFTGLGDTPADYSGGYYLQSTEDGIRYISSTGLADDIGDEIVKTIVTGKLFDFTGLGDTPTGYESGYYLRSTRTGIEYISSTGLADDIIAGMTGIGGTVLKIKDTGTGIEFVEIGELEAGAKAFTGLSDTPADYSGGYYLQSTEDGIRYISSTGLADDIGDEIVKTIVTGKLFDFTGLGDTPTDYSGGYYLQSTEDGIRYISSTGLADDIGDEIVKTIVTGKLFDFTGLGDTPADYSGGYYLQSTEDGIRYISSTGLAEDIGDEIVQTIVTGKLFDFTGLGDTPADYSGGYYLQSTEDGVRYISVTGLADDIIAGMTGIGGTVLKIKDTGTGIEFVEMGELEAGAKAFTGLNDTPADYSGGYYLQSTEDGIRYISSTGLADDIGNEIVKTIVTGKLFDFTGLGDTPTGYSGGYYLQSTENGIRYVSSTGLADDIGDEIVKTIVTGKLFDFTGLGDTPADYSGGYYLQSTENGIRYISSTGLAENISKEVTKTIVTGKLFDFTGLGDTPADYSGGYYLQSTENGIRYISSTGLADDIGDEIVKTIVTGKLFDFTGLGDTPADYSGGYYLQSTENGIRYISSTGLAGDIGEEIVQTIVTGKLFDFTGLSDTPSGYKAYSDKFFVVPSGDRLVYDTVRFLENVSDAPTNQLVDGYLKLVQQGSDLVLQWSAGTTEGDVNYNIDGATHFTGLFDTPTGYKRGYYVRVKEDQDKLEYISSTGLAQDVLEDGDFTFKKLKDTPNYYSNNSIVMSLNDRVDYISIEDISKTLLVVPKKYINIDELPSPAADHDGEVVRVGCNLYISCNGEWILINDPANIKIDNTNYPKCCETLEDFIKYYSYTQDKHSEYWKDNFIKGLNGEVGTKLYSVCTTVDNGTYSANNQVHIDQTNFKYGMFEKNETINLVATPQSPCSFKHWTGDANVINNIQNQFNSNTNISVYDDLAITGVFDCGDNNFFNNDGLNQTIQVTVDNGNYVFDGISSADNEFKFNVGQYTFKNIPESHPIAFHINGINARYGGTKWWGVKNGLDGNEYNYYWGDVILEIDEAVILNGGKVSYECYHHGYMGGQDNLLFDSSVTSYVEPKFSITIDYSKYTESDFGEEEKAELESACQYLESAILGSQLNHVDFTVDFEDYLGIPEAVGGTLAAAGSNINTVLVDENKSLMMATEGYMWADPNDLYTKDVSTNSGRTHLFWVMLHELIHAIGFGTHMLNRTDKASSTLNNLATMDIDDGGQYIGYNGVRGYNHHFNLNFTSLPLYTQVLTESDFNQTQTASLESTNSNISQWFRYSTNSVTQDEIDQGYVIYDSPWSLYSFDNLQLTLPSDTKVGDLVEYDLVQFWNTHTSPSEHDVPIQSGGEDQTIDPFILISPTSKYPLTNDSLVTQLTLGILADLGWVVDFSKTLP